MGRSCPRPFVSLPKLSVVCSVCWRLQSFKAFEDQGRSKGFYGFQIIFWGAEVYWIPPRSRVEGQNLIPSFRGVKGSMLRVRVLKSKIPRLQKVGLEGVKSRILGPPLLKLFLQPGIPCQLQWGCMGSGCLCARACV